MEVGFLGLLAGLHLKNRLEKSELLGFLVDGSQSVDRNRFVITVVDPEALQVLLDSLG